MKDNIIKQFKLPNYIKGKSFADASKAIDKKFAEREDIYSKETKKELMSRLANAQEYLKAKNNVDNSNDKAYGGYQNKMFLGGLTPGFNPDEQDAAKGDKPGLASYMQAAGTAFDLGNTAFGETGIDTSGATKADKVNVGASAAGSALKGASAGMAFGPIGAGVGALVGGVAGLIGGNKAKKDAAEANVNNSLMLNSNYKDMADGGPVGNPNINYKAIDKTFDKLGISDDASLYGAEVINPAKTNMFGENLMNGIKKGGKFLKDNAGNALRYTPILTNALQLANIGKPQVETLDRLGGRYKKNEVDVEAGVNKVQNQYNNTSRAISEASGGSGSTLRANLLGAQLNKTKGISDVYNNATEVNRSENKIAQQFNQNIKNTNLNQSNREKDINARNLGAYNTNKSKLIAQIGNDIGNVGKEEISKKQIKELFGYDWMGEYVKNNPKATKSDIKKAFNKKVATINTNVNTASHGGYLKKK